MGTIPSGHLVISIDLHDDAPPSLGEATYRLDMTTRQLCDLLQRHHIPATWAVADPARCAATDLIMRQRVGHEMAILGDASWIGASVGRTRFARELARRIDSARQRGLTIHTLALRDAELDQHLDLLVKQRICVLRRADVRSTHKSAPFRPYASRYGIWQATVSASLPAARVWWSPLQWYKIRWTLQCALAQRRVAHLVIDATAVQRSTSAWNTVRHLLAYAQRRRQQGTLQIWTLGHMGQWLKRRRTRIAARSILRAA